MIYQNCHKFLILKLHNLIVFLISKQNFVIFPNILKFFNFVLIWKLLYILLKFKIAM